MRLNALCARPNRCAKPRDVEERLVITNNILDQIFNMARPNRNAILGEIWPILPSFSASLHGALSPPSVMVVQLPVSRRDP
jgi:hypothetical protein